jgi:hypothetical protein
LTVIPRCSPLDLVRLWCRAATLHTRYPSLHAGHRVPVLRRGDGERSCCRFWLCWSWAATSGVTGNRDHRIKERGCVI